MNSKTKNIGKWVPSILAAFMILMGASLKIAGQPELSARIAAVGLLSYIKLFAAAEIVFVALFLYARTMKLGLLLLTAYFGGAIATEILHGGMLFPAILLSLVWTGAYLRMPSAFKWSSKNNNVLQLQ